MPLEKGASPEILGRNIRELMQSGRSVEQAAAIAHRYAQGDERAAGICFRSGRYVLLLLRSSGCADYPDLWAFPGGTIEPGETAEQAARREVLEETGLDYQGPLVPFDYDNGFLTFFADLPETFRPALNEEHAGYCWMRPSLGSSVSLLPGCGEAIACLPAVAGQGLDKREYDTNGWFEVKDNPLSKVGVFPYSAASLGVTGADAGKIFQIYRPAEELGAQECLDSFKLLPWIDDHVMLGPVMQENGHGVAAEKKGVQGVIGQDVHFDGEYLRGNIKVFSESLARLIEAGKRELSAGYTCRYDMTPGEWNGVKYDGVQRDIRGNHLALVQEGRMGPDVAVLDKKEGGSMTEENKPAAEGGATDAMTLEQAVAMLKELAPKVAELTAAMASLGKPAETKTEEVNEDACAKPAAMDAAEITRKVMADIAKRDDLARRLSVHVGVFDHAEKTLAEVVAYGCEKLGLRNSADLLEGYLSAKPAEAKPAVAQDTAAPQYFLDAYLKGEK